MANINFTQLTDSADLQATDIFPIVRGNTTDYKASGSYIPTFLGFANSGSGFSLTRGTGPVALTVSANTALNQNLLTTSAPTFASMNVTTQYLISSTSVLTITTLGATVTTSSLTKVGLTSAGYVKTDASGNLSTQVGIPVTDLRQSSTIGNIYYGNGTTLTSLPIGANGQFLSIIAGVPAWGSSGTIIPNPLIVGTITIDGTGGPTGNAIASSASQPFYLSSATSQLIALVSRPSISSGLVVTNTIPYTNDIGAVYAAGTNVNVVSVGTVYYGRYHIISGAITNTNTSPVITQSGGIISFSRPTIGTYVVNFPNGLFRSAPIAISTIITGVIDPIIFIHTLPNATTTSITFVTNTIVATVDGFDFSFIIMGPC